MGTKLPSHSVSEHVAKIENALNLTKEALFKVIVVIKEARDDLGEETFDKELAHQLSISQAVLSKYLKIADDPLLLKRQESLPPTVNTLYELAQTHAELLKTHGSKQGEVEFKELLDSVNKKTEAAEIADYLKKLRREAAAAAKKQREEKVLSVSGTKAVEGKAAQELTSLSALVQAKAVFKTIFINPPPDVLKLAADPGVFVEEIAERYPIADLRAPSQGETVQGFVYCTASHIQAGLKLLTAAGFVFRDVFSPSSGAKGFELLRSEKVLLRGERGAPAHPTLTAQVEANDAGAVSIAQELGGEPRLYVFAAHVVDGWICAAPDQH
jgi:DNA-binding HxlR family transcriptional regulator